MASSATSEIKVKGIRATGENNIYVQFSNSSETFVVGGGTAIADIVVSAFAKGVAVRPQTSPATGPGDYHVVTEIYVGGWS